MILFVYLFIPLFISLIIYLLSLCISTCSVIIIVITYIYIYICVFILSAGEQLPPPDGGAKAYCQLAVSNMIKNDQNISSR